MASSVSFSGVLMDGCGNRQISAVRGAVTGPKSTVPEPMQSHPTPRNSQD